MTLKEGFEYFTDNFQAQRASDRVCTHHMTHLLRGSSALRCKNTFNLFPSTPNMWNTLFPQKGISKATVPLAPSILLWKKKLDHKGGNDVALRAQWNLISIIHCKHRKCLQMKALVQDKTIQACSGSGNKTPRKPLTQYQQPAEKNTTIR